MSLSMLHVTQGAPMKIATVAVYVENPHQATKFSTEQVGLK